MHAIKYHLLFVLAIFLASVCIGYVYGGTNPGYCESMMEELTEYYGGLIDLPLIILALIIFLRNSSLSLMALILGLGLGVIPVLFIVSNAFLIGMLIRVMGRGEGIYFVLMLLLPHGVIEIPAVLLSAAMGVKMGQEVLFALLGREHEIKREFLRCMRRFFLIVLPLLAIAAIIEVYITPLTVI